MGETYVCEMCGEVYESDWTQEEAEKEFEDNFPYHLDEPKSVVCDDCYEILVRNQLFDVEDMNNEPPP